MNTLHPEEVSFGKWLRRQRRMQDLTQQALADQVGIARITLRKIEAGTLRPSKQLTILLLKFFRISNVEYEQWIYFARGKTKHPGHTSSDITLRYRTNLPASLTSFIGRVKEKTDVLGLINMHRLVTLVGTGGVGKTRLSIEVGELLTEDFGIEVWLIDLAPLTDPLLLPQTITSLFGITSHSASTLKNAIFDFLKHKKSVFLFDNCEHLIEACAVFVDELLKMCPYVKVIATSREPLEILGEAVYRVENLEIPDTKFTSDELIENASVQLFIERGQLRQRDFSLTQENAPEVVRICQLLEGHPLAIELAAVHVGNLSLVQIVDQLCESIDLLARENRSVPPRQKSIRASIEWGWRLLTEQERILLSRLSVFSGGWTVRAAEEVCGAGLKNVQQLINQLLIKSFIRQAIKSSEEIRYGSHEIIRQFAYEALMLSGEENAIRDRHQKYFMALSENAENSLKGEYFLAWINRLEEERENLRKALVWSFEMQNFEIHARLASALARFWVIRGPMTEGEKWINLIISRSSILPIRLRAKVYWAAGFLAFSEGNYLDAISNLNLGLSLARDCKEKLLVAETLRIQGLTLLSLRDMQAGRKLLMEGLLFYEKVGDHWGIGWSLNYLADVEEEKKHGDEARRLREKGLAHFRRIKDDRGIGWTLIGLAENHLAQRNIVRCELLSSEALSILRDIDDKRGVARSLTIQAMTANFRREFDKAGKLYFESLVICQQLGYKFGCVLNMLGVYQLAINRKNFDEAAQLLGWLDANRNTFGSLPPMIDLTEIDINSFQYRKGTPAYLKKIEEGSRMDFSGIMAFSFRLLNNNNTL